VEEEGIKGAEEAAVSTSSTVTATMSSTNATPGVDDGDKTMDSEDLWKVTRK
jgi:hypothetical protein